MNPLAFALSVALMVAPVVPQEPAPEPNPWWQDASFYGLTGSYIALAIVDGQQTVYALQNPEYGEGNPLLAGYIEKVGTDGIQPLNIAITAAVTAGLTYAWLKAEKGWQKVIVYCVVGAAVIVQAWVVDSNSRLAFE